MSMAELTAGAKARYESSVGFRLRVPVTQKAARLPIRLPARIPTRHSTRARTSVVPGTLWPALDVRPEEREEAVAEEVEVFLDPRVAAELSKRLCLVFDGALGDPYPEDAERGAARQDQAIEGVERVGVSGKDELRGLVKAHGDGGQRLPGRRGAELSN